MDGFSKFGKFAGRSTKKDATKKCADSSVDAGSNGETHEQIAKETKQLLESSEELFKASLAAKNEEISKVNEILKGVTEELSRELALVHRLNAQLAAASNDLMDKEEALASANSRISELEREKEDLQRRYEMALRGAVVQEGSDEEAAARREKEQQDVVDALRERATNAEREAFVLQGMVAGMQQMLLSVWDGREDEVAALRQRVAGLEQRQGVWEAEASMEKGRCGELEARMAGKDEIIKALQERLEEAEKGKL